MINKIIIALCILCTLLSCNKNNEVIPAYIYINEAIVETDYPTEGTTSNDVNSVFVAIDDISIGVFELPALVPIITTGEVDITIQAAVPRDGSFANFISYVPYTFYNTTRTLTTDVADTIQPTFKYRTAAQFLLLNDFENSNNLEVLEEEVTFSSINNDQVFEGSRSGFVELTEENPTFTLVTIESVDVPDLQQPNFVEFNYKCDGLLQFYISGLDFTSSTPSAFLDDILFIKPIDDWNKLYVDLSDYLLAKGDVQSLHIGFRAIIPDSLTTANYYLDNIKFIHVPL